MIQKNLIDQPAISPEEESRMDLELRSEADDLLENDFYCVIERAIGCEFEVILHKIYHSSGDDELLAVHDLKSLLFNTALEIVKRGK